MKYPLNLPLLLHTLALASPWGETFQANWGLSLQRQRQCQECKLQIGSGFHSDLYSETVKDWHREIEIITVICSVAGCYRLQQQTQLTNDANPEHAGSAGLLALEVRAHTHTHTRMQACKHRHALSHIWTHTNAWKHTHIKIHKYKLTHTDIHPNTHAHTDYKHYKHFYSVSLSVLN